MSEKAMLQQSIVPEYEGAETHFRHLLEILPAGAYTCDAEGLITYFNQAAVRIWGRQPQLNDPVDRFCGSFRLFSVDGAPLTHNECWMALALRTGESFLGEEIVIERQDGTRRHVLAHATPMRSARKIVGAVNVLVDITDQKRAEESRALLASIIESSEDAIVSKNLNGQILSWNAGAESLFGYSADEAVGAHISLIIPPDRLEEEHQILERLRSGGRIQHFETVRVAKNGRLVDVSLTISPVRDSSGRTIAASKVARDITARKAADRRKDEFLATLAHELRNPLAPLRNSLHLLRLSKDLSPALYGIRDIMEQQVDHLVRLVDDLLDVSRIARGKIQLRKERLELAGVIERAVELSRPHVDAGGHELTVSLPSQPLIAEVDPVRVAQIIANVLTNAAKYTPTGGQIWLTVTQEDAEAVVSIRDNGIGISRELLPRIFDLYTQADHTLSRAQGGLGIGLTLAKNLLLQHGGQIEARSQGEGRGSEFVIRLPLMTAQGSVDLISFVPRPEKTPIPSYSILVVDDTRAAAYLLGKLLEALGQEVRTVDSGAAALEAAILQCPDIVISDIAMPRMDGYELARRLRTLPGMHRVILVALSGYGQDSDREQALDAGFNYHLVKPTSLESLEYLLRSLRLPKLDSPATCSAFA